MMRNSVIVDQWRPEKVEYIKQMSDWASENADLSAGIYNSLDPNGDSDAAIAAIRINQKWDEVLPELITASSEAEFDTIFNNYIASRDEYGFDLVMEYKQSLLNERKEKLAD
jgi:putative aldouronate transport system substrate-binding protein